MAYDFYNENQVNLAPKPGDYTQSKDVPGSVFPENTINTVWTRVEPLITAEQLQRRFLFGIPLQSGMIDPVTKKYQTMGTEDLKDHILRAASRLETQTGLDIFPIQREEKQPFDRQLYDSFNYMKLDHRPISKIDAVIVSPASGVDVFKIPLEWIETSYLAKGLIYLVPLSPVAVGQGTFLGTSQGGGNGSLFLSVLGTKAWIPAYWKVHYTSGFPDSAIPKVMNDLIGIEAAIEVLSVLASTYGRVQSQSLGIDGLSQSVAGPGQQIFSMRIDKLKEDRKAIADRLKAIYGIRLFVSNV